MPRTPKKYRPKDIFYDGKVHIIFYDGAHCVYNYWELRTACTCADCVDEITGQKILDDSSVPETIHPKDSEYVGNYGLQIHWSDGHNTGIYNFRNLRDQMPHETLQVD